MTPVSTNVGREERETPGRAWEAPKTRTRSSRGILQKPETARAVLIGFPSSEQAGACVAAIIAKGIIPGGMEMMDGPAIRAAEARRAALIGGIGLRLVQ